MEIIIKELRKIEPNYNSLLGINKDDQLYKGLNEIIIGNDEILAQRAIVLASIINTEESRDMILKACSDIRDSVRAAIVSRISVFEQNQQIEILEAMLNDKNPAVRRMAIQQVSSKRLSNFKEQLLEMSKSDANQFIKENSKIVMNIISNKD